MVRLVDAACVEPEELDSIESCLLGAELYLLVAGFVRSFSLLQVSKSDFVCISTPCVRQYRVPETWNLALMEILGPVGRTAAVIL